MVVLCLVAYVFIVYALVRWPPNDDNPPELAPPALAPPRRAVSWVTTSVTPQDAVVDDWAADFESQPPKQQKKKKKKRKRKAVEDPDAQSDCSFPFLCTSSLPF